MSVSPTSDTTKRHGNPMNEVRACASRSLLGSRRIQRATSLDSRLANKLSGTVLRVSSALLFTDGPQKKDVSASIGTLEGTPSSPKKWPSSVRTAPYGNQT